MRTKNTFMGVGLAIVLTACGQQENQNTVGKPPDPSEKNEVTQVEKPTQPPPAAPTTSAASETQPAYRGPSFLELLVPEQNEEVSGKVNILVSASPDITRVEILLEEQLLASGNPGELEQFEWDSGMVSDGEYRVFLIGRSEKQTLKVRRNIVVKNLLGGSRETGRLFILNPQPGVQIDSGKLAVEIVTTSELPPSYIKATVDDTVRSKSLNLTVDPIDVKGLDAGDHLLSVTAYGLKDDRVLAADQAVFRVPKREAPKAETTTKVEPPCNHTFPSKEALLECLATPSCGLIAYEDYGTYFLGKPKGCGFDCAYLGVRVGIKNQGDDQNWTRYAEPYCLESELLKEESDKTSASGSVTVSIQK